MIEYNKAIRSQRYYYIYGCNLESRRTTSAMVANIVIDNME